MFEKVIICIPGAVESADEGIGSMSPEHSGSGEESRSELMELRRETMDLRIQLERERRHRLELEEHYGQQLVQQQQQQQHEMLTMKYEPERLAYLNFKYINFTRKMFTITICA